MQGVLTSRGAGRVGRPPPAHPPASGGRGGDRRQRQVRGQSPRTTWPLAAGRAAEAGAASAAPGGPGPASLASQQLPIRPAKAAWGVGGRQGAAHAPRYPHDCKGTPPWRSRHVTLRRKVAAAARGWAMAAETPRGGRGAWRVGGAAKRGGGGGVESKKPEGTAPPPWTPAGAKSVCTGDSIMRGGARGRGGRREGRAHVRAPALPPRPPPPLPSPLWRQNSKAIVGHPRPTVESGLAGPHPAPAPPPTWRGEGIGWDGRERRKKKKEEERGEKESKDEKKKYAGNERQVGAPGAPP